MHKILYTLTQDGYFQYIEYDIELPPMKKFHFCVWMKSINLSTEHPLFSYGENPNMIAMWISPVQNQTGFDLVINGVKVCNLNYIIPVGQWVHICQSWNGENGQWVIFYNGNSVGDGYGPQKLIGYVIPGGGKSITGQQQHSFSRGDTKSEGIQGEITLLEMSDTSIPIGSKGTQFVRQLQNDCKPKISDALINWGETDLRLYGGAKISVVNPICALFPKHK